MTHPRLRRHRSGDDRDATEFLESIRPADWDGRTYEFTGASSAGLPDDGINYDTSYDATGWEPEPATAPLAALRARPPAPGMLPAAGFDTIARDMTHGWQHLFELRCAYPAARAETPIPCDSAHRDPAAGSFRALRRSAFAAGWHLDALGRLACPRCCQASPEYRTLYPLTVHDARAAEAYAAGDLRGEAAQRAGAEHDLFRDVHDTARHGRHEAGAR